MDFRSQPSKSPWAVLAYARPNPSLTNPNIKKPAKFKIDPMCLGQTVVDVWREGDSLATSFFLLFPFLRWKLVYSTDQLENSLANLNMDYMHFAGL